jgi:hypothetical protein
MTLTCWIHFQGKWAGNVMHKAKAGAAEEAEALYVDIEDSH